MNLDFHLILSSLLSAAVISLFSFRHRIELHYLALCCWLGPNDEFLL